VAIVASGQMTRLVHLLLINKLLGGQVVKALDCRSRGPRFWPHYSNRGFFHLGVYSALPKKVSRCGLKVFSPEVYTASFGGDVKPSVPVDLV